MSITEAQRTELRKALAADAIATRDGSGNNKLSYLHGHYVIREMNRIFGNGAWGYRATVTKEYEGVNEKQQYVCTYLGRCVLTVGDCVIEDVGAGQGQDKRPGEAIEKASKEAATDALKRCCKTLGDPLGLALYDKEQRHVADDADPDGHSDAGKALYERIKAAKTADEKRAAQKATHDAWESLTKADQTSIKALVEEQKKAKVA